MSGMRLFVAAFVIAAVPMASVASGQTFGPREAKILAALDTDGDGTISCPELAAFLDPVVVKALRDQGIEPKDTSRVPACGPRTGGGPAPANDADRSPERNYREFFRELIRHVLNTTTSDNPSDDAVTHGEIKDLENAALPSPFTGNVDSLLPKPDSAGATDGGSWVDALAKRIQVRQSFLDDAGIGKPAKLSWTDHADGDETLDPGDPSRTYTINAAVILNVPKEWTFFKHVLVRPVAAYEMDVTSNAPEKDQIVTRVGLSSLFLRKTSTAPFSSHVVDWTFDYSTNRGYKATVFGTTLQYTPNYLRIGIGRYLGGGAPIDFRWRPYAGLVWSDVKDADDVAAYKKLTTFTHEYLRFTGEIRLTGRGKVTPEFKLWHGDRTDAAGAVTHWQTQGSIEGRLALSQSKGVDRASITLTYTHGRDSPDFLLEKSVVLALAIKL